MSHCELCASEGGFLLWQHALCRVVRVDHPLYPGYCRVIWNAHIKEMTDLSLAEQRFCLQVVLSLETVLRELFSPDKINLASFGNMTPHVHWHVLPRWHDDPHFPEPLWGKQFHDTPSRRAPVVTDAQLHQRCQEHLGQLTACEFPS